MPSGGGLPPYLMGVRSRIGESVRAARREYEASLATGGPVAPSWAVPGEEAEEEGSTSAAGGEGSGEAAPASPTTVREVLGEALYEAGLAAEEEEGGPSAGPGRQQEEEGQGGEIDPAEVTLS